MLDLGGPVLHQGILLIQQRYDGNAGLERKSDGQHQQESSRNA